MAAAKPEVSPIGKEFIRGFEGKTPLVQFAIFLDP
jgi:hypothetical protein